MLREWLRQPSSKLILALTAVSAVALTFLVADVLAQDEAGKQAVPNVVARIGGQDVDRDALLSEASASLAQVEAEREKCVKDADRKEHEALESAVERLVHKRLFSLEAGRRGLTEDALREEIRLQANEVSDSDVDDFYQQNQARINQSKEQVAEQIRSYIRQQRLQKAETDFFEQAGKGFEVDYFLEPLRVDVAAAGPARGNDKAPVTIVEFSDFQCPYCKRVLPTLDQVQEKFGDKVRVVFRHYPLSIHADAQKAAEASLCAHDQGKFWEMHDLLFEEQQKLAPPDLKEKAGRLELDADTFAECLDSGRHAEAVEADLRDGTAAGVDGTPAFFVNGRFISGAVPYETIAPVIEDEIRRSARSGNAG